MKKAVILLLAIVMSTFLFFGCEKEYVFDFDEAVFELADEGLTLSYYNARTGGFLDYDTKSFNSEIIVCGGDFTVEVTKIAHLNAGNYYDTCVLAEFKTEQMAKNYAELRLADRDRDLTWKIAREGRVVIITDLELAMRVIRLEFQ